jgi:hypothetical protein
VAQLVYLGSTQGQETERGLEFSTDRALVILRTWGQGGLLQFRIVNRSADSLNLNLAESRAQLTTRKGAISWNLHYASKSNEVLGLLTEPPGWELVNQQAVSRLKEWNPTEGPWVRMAGGESAIVSGWRMPTRGRLSPRGPAERIEGLRIINPTTLEEDSVRWLHFTRENSPGELVLDLAFSARGVMYPTQLQAFVRATCEVLQSFVEPSRGYWTVATGPDFRRVYRKFSGWYGLYLVGE